jgi:peptidoglycan/xylan/chitin deacetylase (PgdA/CDA1 family)
MSVVVGCLLILAIGSWGVTLQGVLQPSSKEHVQAAPAIQKALPPPPAQQVDCSATPCIALTFDDGPNPITTPKVLDILDKYHVPATFFVVGSRVPGQEAIIRRMHTSGHEIGSHSWDHHDFTDLSSAQILDQLNRTQSAIVNAGVPAPTLFRPPYGAVNPNVRGTVPMTLAMWNIDPLDWQTKDPNKVRDIIVSHAKPGGIIDLHDIYPVTAESLEPTIEALRPNYRFVTFSQMFDLYAGQRGEYFGR